MARLKFGAFLAPHHPIGEHPMLQFRGALDLVERFDKLGYDEFWCGEHHSTGHLAKSKRKRNKHQAWTGRAFKSICKNKWENNQTRH